MLLPSCRLWIRLRAKAHSIWRTLGACISAVPIGAAGGSTGSYFELNYELIILLRFSPTSHLARNYEVTGSTAPSQVA